MGVLSFPIVLVPRYKSSLCHAPIKPDLLSFPGIGAMRVGCVITRFASYDIAKNHNFFHAKGTLFKISIQLIAHYAIH